MVSNYASQIVADKMRQLSSRINTRMQEISSKTGIQFSEMFAARIQKAVQAEDISSDNISVEDDKTAPEAETPAGLTRGNYTDLIKAAAQKYGVEAQLVSAVMWAESNFNPNVVSKAGAMGLMQLMPGTAQYLGVEDAFDPAQNVDGGVRYLAQRLKDYGGDVLKALAAYNCGPTGLASRGITDLRDPAQFGLLPKEIQAYITRIEGYLEAMGKSDILM